LLFLPSFFFRIPFGNAVSADDDLFPPIRPPVDATILQTDDAEEGEDVATDADADAVMGDGSDASEESDEVSCSVQKEKNNLPLKMVHRTLNS